MRTCTECGKKFAPPICPLPCYNCACKGNYCRLLGRDPCTDTKCAACLAKR